MFILISQARRKSDGTHKIVADENPNGSLKLLEAKHRTDAEFDQCPIKLFERFEY